MGANLMNIPTLFLKNHFLLSAHFSRPGTTNYPSSLHNKHNFGFISFITHTHSQLLNSIFLCVQHHSGAMRGAPRGFAFVEMSTRAEAVLAQTNADGYYIFL